MLSTPSLTIALLTLALALPQSACRDRPAAWTQPLAITGPLRVADTVMWVDSTRGLAFALDPGAADPSVRHASIPRRAVWANPSPARDELLVLTAGREPEREGQTREDPRLTVLRPDSGGAPAVRTALPLPAPFDRLAVSTDGKHAVAWFADTTTGTGTGTGTGTIPIGGTGNTGGTVFRNPNALALIDLAAPAGPRNPVARTIRSLGASPRGIAFSPPFTIGQSAPRTIAVILATGYVTLLDLSHPERAEITIPLTSSSDGTIVTPEQVVFDVASTTIFVRAVGSTDVFALALAPRPTTDPLANDFLPHVNQPSAGRTVRDMLLFDDGGKTWLLTANGGDLAVIDAETSEFAILPLTSAGGGIIDALLPIPAGAPTRAIGWSRTAKQSAVFFIDLAQISTRLDRAVTRRALARPVHELVPVPGDAQLLVVHDDARTVLSILDLGPRRVDTPILGNSALDSFDFAGAGYLVGVSRGLDRLGVLDLSTLNASEIRLDWRPRRVLAAGPRIVVDHGDPAGLVTVVPAPTARREDTRALWGFFLDGLLDQALED